MIFFFFSGMIELNIALNIFYNSIFQLYQVYKWQETVFPLVIKVHMYIILLQPSNSAKWEISPTF